ncbi:MAG: HypC/HybG/HupF family hydrogenase formation chaperone [Candidatus Paceibacterota bacterium]|jgi:hydrogenase expression/formation protein HypC
MCLAIPGKIIKIDKKTNVASVDFGGIKRDVNISLVEIKKGDYVIVHAGYAIQKIDNKEAKETLKLFETARRGNDE